MPTQATRKDFRVNQEVLDKVKELNLKFPSLYPSESHVIRASINFLYHAKIKKPEVLRVEEF